MAVRGSRYFLAACLLLAVAAAGHQQTMGTAPGITEVVNDGMIDGHAQHRSNEASQAADEAPRRAASSGTTSSTAPKDPVTTWKCYRMGAWGDVCVYNNICFDGSFWTFLDPTSENVNLGAPPTVFGRRDMLEGYLVPYRRVPDVDDQTFPFNSGAKGRFVNPSTLQAPDVSMTWTTQTMWRPAFDVSLSNIWYFSTRVMPMFRARRMNETGLFPTPLPAMSDNDILFIALTEGRRKYGGTHEWHKAVMNVSTGGKIPMYVANETWARQWSPKHQVCFHKAVMTGAFAYVMPDIQTGFEFREAMYEYMNMTLPKKPAKKVLFWLRTPLHPRELLNTDELIKVVESYNLSYTVVTRVPPFREQLELFSTHGVVVSPHGAGLTNQMFLVPFSAVVELFPYHMDHTLYPVLASHVGVANYPVHAINGSNIWARYPEYFTYNCDELPNLEISYRSSWCRAGVMNKGFAIGPRDFEAALVNAIQHAGYRVRFQDIRPRKVPGTLTGFGRL